jgi:hypothetical protein
MKKSLFSMRDIKTGQYEFPFPAHTPDEAIRMVYNTAQDSNTMIARHPEDFTLANVGEFDTESGVVEALTAPEHVANVADIVPSAAEIQAAGKPSNG